MVYFPFTETSPEKTSAENSAIFSTPAEPTPSVNPVDVVTSHDASSSTTSTYKCPKCEKTYSIAKSLRNHCRVAHDLLAISFCQVCDEVFVNQLDKDAHSLTHQTDAKTSPNSPSSPEEFYGFVTPTKEMEKAKELLSVKRKLSLSNF